jgi:hypothetical protein
MWGMIRFLKIILAVVVLGAPVFVAGFWTGAFWTEKHRTGTVVNNKDDALIYLLCTQNDTPQECARKLVNGWKRQYEAEEEERRLKRMAN